MKIGALVRNHIDKIQSYCESNPDELLKLMDTAYSKNNFNLNWPFFAESEGISSINRVRYWRDHYVIGDKRLRACSQWFEKDRETFNRYLQSKGIVNSGLADPLLPVDLPKRPAPTRNIRYKAIAVGNAQNLLVRAILSNLGQESFGQSHWEDTKSYFGRKCAYCGEAKELHMDHGVPINKTSLGEHRLGNLIPSCKQCNDDKHYADFKQFLGNKIEQIARIEAYMASRNYTPLGDNEHLKMIVEQAHEEVAALARRYVSIINAVLAGKADAA